MRKKPILSIKFNKKSYKYFYSYDNFECMMFDKLFSKLSVLLAWDKKYNLQITEIDRQHQKLVEMLNLLNTAFIEKQQQNIVKEILKQMAEYAVYHFSYEEKYFREFNYVNTAEHIEEHRNFMDKVQEFEEKYQTNPGVLSIEVLNFLKDWLVNHINGSDRKYIKCFRDNGME